MLYQQASKWNTWQREAKRGSGGGDANTEIIAQGIIRADLIFLILSSSGRLLTRDNVKL